MFITIGATVIGIVIVSAGEKESSMVTEVFAVPLLEDEPTIDRILPEI